MKISVNSKNNSNNKNNNVNNKNNSSNKNNNVNSKKKLKRKPLTKRLRRKLTKKLREKPTKKLKEKLTKKLEKKLKSNNSNKIPEEIYLTRTEMLLQQSLNKQKKKSVSLNEKSTSFLLSFSLHIAFLFRYTTVLIEYTNGNYSVSL